MYISPSSSSSSCSWRVRSVILFLNPQDESWSLHLFLGRPVFLRPFGLYCNACFSSLFVSILCTCCSHFFWYCFTSFTILCAPVFPLIHWFFSLSNFVIPSKCLKNFICAATKRCSSLFFSTQASLPNFSAAFAVMLWIYVYVYEYIIYQIIIYVFVDTFIKIQTTLVTFIAYFSCAGKNSPTYWSTVTTQVRVRITWQI